MTRRTLAAAVVALALTGPAFAAAAAPLVHEREALGESREGRPIVALHRGDPDASTVLVVGCIHGDECAGLEIARLLARAEPRHAVDLWVVPNLNPDGRAVHARQNARGVDLNRNFPYRWRPGPRGRYYPGPRPASEPETRIAMRLVERIEPDITVWYHQPLAMIVRSKGRLRIQREYARLVGLPLRTLDPLHGTATSWQNHRAETSTAFVVELRGGSLEPADARRHARAVFRLVDGR